MNYLSLDLSTKSTGWCIKTENNILLDYGCITNSSTLIEKRLSHMGKAIAEIAQKYQIGTAILEEVPNVPNTDTYKKLTWLHGVVRTALYETNNKINIVTMQSAAWRSRIGIKTGRGIRREQLKQADIEYAKEHYNIESLNDDIADAICLSDAYFSQPVSAF